MILKRQGGTWESMQNTSRKEIWQFKTKVNAKMINIFCHLIIIPIVQGQVVSEVYFPVIDFNDIQDHLHNEKAYGKRSQ